MANTCHYQWQVLQLFLFGQFKKEKFEKMNFRKWNNVINMVIRQSTWRNLGVEQAVEHKWVVRNKVAELLDLN